MKVKNLNGFVGNTNAEKVARMLCECNDIDYNQFQEIIPDYRI